METSRLLIMNSMFIAVSKIVIWSVLVISDQNITIQRMSYLLAFYFNIILLFSLSLLIGGLILLIIFMVYDNYLDSSKRLDNVKL